MSAALTSSRNPGRHDHAARRRAKRSGREGGCWTYIPAELLTEFQHAEDGGAPFYRVWGGQRSRYVVTLYREP